MLRDKQFHGNMKYKDNFIKKIISGGQTGVDRAALDIAIELKIPHGGYCPKDRQAEDGIIPSKYNLIENDSIKYSDRTRQNVESSEGTLILHTGIISNGTEITKEYCIKRVKPLMILNILSESKSCRLNFNHWLKKNSINILNVAGPKESVGAIYNVSKNVLRHLLCDE